MNIEDKVLELIKEKPLLMVELQRELRQYLLTSEVIDVMAFLEKHKLVEVMASANHGLMAKITEKGVQLLNLPDLPEDETTGEEITELMEQRVTGKTITIYALSQHTETANWIDAMAMRFNVSGNDVIRAMWFIAKDSVWAKLEQDVKGLKKRQTGFSESTINSIKAREDERQQKIAEAAK